MYSIRVYDQDEQPVSGKYAELSITANSIKTLHPRMKMYGLVCFHCTQNVTQVKKNSYLS